MADTSTFFFWNDPFSVGRSRLGSNPWSPYLNTILQRLASNISTNPKFHPELVDMQEELSDEPSTFISFFADKDSMDVCSSAFTVIGNIGIGKSSFLEWWQSLDTRKSRSAEIDINDDGIRCRNSNMPITQYVPKTFSERLNLNTVLDPELDGYLQDAARSIQKAAHGQGYDNFTRAFLNQSFQFRNDFPDFDHRYVLLCKIDAINRRYNLPVWLILDNVDMEQEELQDNYVRGALETYAWLVSSQGKCELNPRLHLVVTARPGTYRRWQHHLNSYADITYPRPHLHPILVSRLRDGLTARGETPPFRRLR